MGVKRRKTRAPSQVCKYCGAELHDYREFCNPFCRADYEDDKADFYREYDQFDQMKEMEL